MPISDGVHLKIVAEKDATIAELEYALHYERCLAAACRCERYASMQGTGSV